MRTRRDICAKVAITQNQSEAKALQEGLELLNFNQMITSEDVVVITPNWVVAGQPETGQVVGPETLRHLIQAVKCSQPKRIVIATGPAQEDVESLMRQVGFWQVIQEEQVEFINLNKGPFIRLEINHTSPHQLNLNKLYEEMTFLISFTQLKIHEEATVSASIKNITMGWPAGDEQGYPKKDLGIHKDLHGFMAALYEKFTVDFAIVSASPAMIGTGPNKGIASPTGIVLCGTDPLSTDIIGARLLGFRQQAVHYLYKIAQKGLGCATFDLEANKGIRFLGIPLDVAEEKFSACAYQTSFAIDATTSKK